MSIPIIICDDSSFARKQMARALPPEWEVEVTFAENGEEAIALIREGKGEVMFLDLTMPVMDGYQTLELIKGQDLPCMVIVVSGDVQPEAVARVKQLGAIEFIEKPIDTDKARQVLVQYGVM
ncbi:response regulator [Salinispirillum marinum]|uniref:Response regulator n=2 Tax=Saccharospirillaceae TaxID=255527 RepID=A0ABV8BDA8_9GAMM